MADISARRREGLGEMGPLDRAWSFEENCRDDQAFHESEIIRGKSLRRYRSKRSVARLTVNMGLS